MRRVLSLVLSTILSFAPLGPAWAQSSGSESKEDKMKKLVELLSSFSDEDYEAALSRVPGGAAKSPHLASRGTVMQSAYTTLAGYEYQKASRKAAEGEKGRYEEAYNRVGGPQALQEAGWQMDVLKWVGNAALNYWLKGGQDFMGGGGATPGAMASPGAEAFTDTGAAIEAEATADAHFNKGQEYERLASAAVKADTQAERFKSRKERLKKVIELLKSVSDEDYRQAKSQASKEETKAPQLASRAKALQSAYAAMAVLEYEGASKEGPGGLGHDEARQKAVEESAKALGVAPGALQEAGWQVDLLKWLGNAALNYWLYGGKDLVGGERGADPRTAQAEQTLAGLELKLADPAAGPEKRAEIRHQMGAAYEALAADAVEPETEGELAARKKERLRLLAELLSAVSEDEYKEALDMVPGEGTKTHLASRGDVLKSAYTTLAALEYRDAERQAPVEAALQYSANLERVTREGGDNLVVEPKTLKERGWGKKLLGLAALGGVGYAVYHFNKQGHRKKRGNNNPTKHYTPGCPPGKVAGPSGCEEEKPVKPGTRQCANWSPYCDCSASPKLDPSMPPPSTNSCPDTCICACGPGKPIKDGRCDDPGPTASWSPGPAMQFNRAAPLAVLLKDGRVLVAGGSWEGQNPVSSEIYDPAKRRWSSTGDIVEPRLGYAFTALADGGVFAVGLNRFTGEPSSLAMVYHAESGKWTKTAPNPLRSWGQSVTRLNDGRVLVAGGSTEAGASAEATIYNPATDNWESAGTMSEGRFFHSATLLADGKVLVAGGRYTSGAEVYDPATGTWARTGSMSRPRSRHSTIRLPNGRVLVASGEDPPQEKSTSEIYDPRVGRWGEVASMSHWDLNQTAALLPGGKVLVFGGEKHKNSECAENCRTQIYDPAAGTWNSGGFFKRFEHSAVLMRDGRVMAIGGSPGPSVMIYDPAAESTAPVAAGLGMDLLETLLMLAGELASSELTPEVRAEIHGKRAAVYEQLALAALPSKAAPGKPAAAPPVAPRVQEKVPEPELTPEEEVRRRAEKSMGDLDKESRRKTKR